MNRQQSDEARGGSNAPGGAVPFEKLDGAGNDFVLLRSPEPIPGPEQIRFLLHRNHGIGGDGLIHLTLGPDTGVSPVADRDAEASSRSIPRPTVPVPDAPLAAVARYWNADGGAAEYCGNGARCVASVLLEGEEPGAEIRFRLSDVTVRARRSPPGGPGGLGGPGGTDPERTAAPLDIGSQGPGRDDEFAVAHPMPRALALPPAIERLARDLDPVRTPVAFDSGVPHLILEVSDVDVIDLGHWGPLLRGDPSWGPGGTNVDLVSRDPNRDCYRVRTWERGVEGETLACGSGLLAVGIWLGSVIGEHSLSLTSASGARFRAWAEDGEAWLSGPARRVFRGEIELP